MLRQVSRAHLQGTETVPEEVQTLNLLHKEFKLKKKKKEFKSTVLNTPEELKEMMDKELKETRMMSHQTENQ